MLKKSGLLTLHRGGESFADLGGLGALKAFCLRALRRQGQADHSSVRGAWLWSRRPAAENRQFAKALGNETGRPTLVLDIGSLMGSLVGPNRIPDPAGPADRRCDGPLRAVCRRDRQGAGRRRPVRARATAACRPGCSARCCPGSTTTSRRVLHRHLQRHRRSCRRSSFARERFDGLFFLDLPAARSGRRSGRSISISSDWIPAKPGPRTSTGPGPRSAPAAGWRHCLTCRSSRPPATSCPWRSPPANRSSGCGTGPRAAAWRPIGRESTAAARGRDGQAGPADQPEPIDQLTALTVFHPVAQIALLPSSIRKGKHILWN